MHMKTTFTKSIVLLALVIGAPLAASAAQLPGEHPGYLHALTDLRAARWFLYHQPGDARVSQSEDVAIIEIDRAIQEVKRAAIEDGKDVNDHPPVDTFEHGSKLLRAIETLRKARGDISGEEDNPEARDLRRRAFEHIDRAIQAAQKAHADWLVDRR